MNVVVLFVTLVMFVFSMPYSRWLISLFTLYCCFV